MSYDLSEYQTYSNAIDKAFEVSLAGNNYTPPITCVDLRPAGKKVRGILALLSCEAISGNYHQALPVAVAFESVHSAALIQDDIIDDSPMRRHEQSLAERYGSSTAILASDILIFEILRQLATYRRSELSKRRLCNLLVKFHESLTATVHGEFVDVSLGKRQRVHLREYLRMVKDKTGMLFSAPAACGAIVALGSKQQVDALGDFGENLGIAFQIIDDLNDILSEQEIIGKPIFNDIRNCRANILVVRYLQRSSPSSERQFIKHLFGRQSFSNEEIRKARQIFRNSGSVDFANNLAVEMARRGSKRIETLCESPAKKKLLRLSDILLEMNR